MYVKWELRQRTARRRTEVRMFGGRPRRFWSERGPDTRTLIATLVENRRVEGQPRQRRICYLGSIREDRLDRVRERRQFYEQAADRMERAGVPEAERLKILMALRQRVPVPSRDDWDTMGIREQLGWAMLFRDPAP